MKNLRLEVIKYAKMLNTKKLSNSAIKLREAIMSSTDPEDALFNQFPSALGYHTIALKEDEKVLSSFTTNIQEAIREIRTAYDDLINRTESVILKSFACSSTDFKKYKQEIILSLIDLRLKFPAFLPKSQIGVFVKAIMYYNL